MGIPSRVIRFGRWYDPARSDAHSEKGEECRPESDLRPPASPVSPKGNGAARAAPEPDGVRVADVARLTGWQGYDWRRRARGGGLALPEQIVPSLAIAALVVDEGPQRPAPAVGIEITVGDILIQTTGRAEHMSVSEISF